MDESERHLRLLTETIEAVNSTLDLEEVLGLVARRSRTRSAPTPASSTSTTSGRRARAARDPRHERRGDDQAPAHAARRGDHRRRRGRAGAGDDPGAGPSRPALQQFPNLPEDDYESILAVPILSRDPLEGALNVRTLEPREFTQDEIELLLAIAAQVAQSIEHAQLYARRSGGSPSSRRSRRSPRPSPSRSTSRSRSRRS